MTEHMNADGGRCLICEWPYAASVKDGCVPGNCAYRPDSPDEQRRIAMRRLIVQAKTWDGNPPRPGTATDSGTIPDTAEMWSMYYRCGGRGQPARVAPVAYDRPLANRQVRRVLIPAYAVLDHFVIGHTERLPRFLQYPVMSNLPRDVRIEGMPYLDNERACFVFLVSHPSFPPVPDGEVIPAVEGPMLTEYRAVEVKNPG